MKRERKETGDFLLGDFFKFHIHCKLRSRYDIQFCIVSQEAPGPLGAPWVQGKNLYFEFLLDSSSSPAQYLFVFTPFENDAVTVVPGFQETSSLLKKREGNTSLGHAQYARYLP